jgi:trehalose-6-phosphate synthase
LPYRREILEGILSADLIGFHTYDYVRHFITSCTRILGLNSSPASVDYDDRTVKVGAYPVGVEPEKFEKVKSKNQTISKDNRQLSVQKYLKRWTK